MALILSLELSSFSFPDFMYPTEFSSTLSVLLGLEDKWIYRRAIRQPGLVMWLSRQALPSLCGMEAQGPRETRSEAAARDSQQARHRSPRHWRTSIISLYHPKNVQGH